MCTKQCNQDHSMYSFEMQHLFISKIIGQHKLVEKNLNSFSLLIQATDHVKHHERRSLKAIQATEYASVLWISPIHQRTKSNQMWRKRFNKGWNLTSIIKIATNIEGKAKMIKAQRYDAIKPSNHPIKWETQSAETFVDNLFFIPLSIMLSFYLRVLRDLWMNCSLWTSSAKSSIPIITFIQISNDNFASKPNCVSVIIISSCYQECKIRCWWS
jgi:hypothetical protein